MKGHKGVKRTSLFASLSLIITFAFLINADITRAQTFDTMFLLGGQGASSGTSSTQPASFHTIWVTSIANSTLSATISGPSSGSGIAWVMIFGTGGKNWGDIAFGPVPNSGIKVLIDIGKDLSFATVIGGVILSSPVSAEAPARYSFSIGH
ncbi:MAG: hypothetical protein KAJ00_11965 [Deltaproteobacteria bacterium]|nr:hypothetical protein [Deltaproteobacteria bacterium]